MKAFVQHLLVPALFVTALAAAPTAARACDDEAGSCSCGAAHAAEQPAADVHHEAGGCMGDPQHAGSCACAGADAMKAGAAAASADAAKKDGTDTSKEAGNAAGAADTKNQPHQVAVIDPATGEPVAPADGETGEAAAPAAGEAGAAAVAPVVQIAQPGGGMMAAFPAGQDAKMAATVDPSGKVHASCGQ